MTIEEWKEQQFKAKNWNEERTKKFALNYIFI